MPKRLPKYVNRHRRGDGTVTFYFRRGRGPYIRLPSPDDRTFDAAYAAALAGSASPPEATAAAGTLAWLIETYKRSAQWAQLAPSTRRMRDNILKHVAREAGHVPFSAIGKQHINEAIDRKPPHAGANFRKVMSQLFAWAVSVDKLKVNPVDHARRPRVKTKGHHTWTVEEVARFHARWPVGTRERLCMDLALFTGLRRSDLAILGRQHLREGVISIQTGKTKAWVHVPVFPILQASIDAMPATGLAFLTTKAGKPHGSAASMGNWFRAACVAAGVPGRLHGLRKAGATIAADAGATPHQLMAMYGWRKLEEAELYTREADRKRAAAAAAERIEARFLRKTPTG